MCVTSLSVQSGFETTMSYSFIYTDQRYFDMSKKCLGSLDYMTYISWFEFKNEYFSHRAPSMKHEVFKM